MDAPSCRLTEMCLRTISLAHCDADYTSERPSNQALLQTVN